MADVVNCMAIKCRGAAKQRRYIFGEPIFLMVSTFSYRDSIAIVYKNMYDIQGINVALYYLTLYFTPKSFHSAPKPLSFVKLLQYNYPSFPFSLDNLICKWLFNVAVGETTAIFIPGSAVSSSKLAALSLHLI